MIGVTPMTTGVPFLYSEYSNSFTEKGICHVNKYIYFFKNNPDPPRACHRADCHPGCRRNNWFRLDTNRSSYRTSRFEATRWAVEAVHLPVPSLGRSVH